MAAGIEDHGLPNGLRSRDPEAAPRIVRSCVRALDDADEDADHFETVRGCRQLSRTR